MAILFLPFSRLPALRLAKNLRLNSTPKAFQLFYVKFKNAVIKGDKVTVLHEFSFDYGFDAGDEGKYSRTQFMKRFNDIFGREKTSSDEKPGIRK